MCVCVCVCVCMGVKRRCTVLFNIKTLKSGHTVYLCVPCGPRSKQAKREYGALTK